MPLLVFHRQPPGVDQAVVMDRLTDLGQALFQFGEELAKRMTERVSCRHPGGLLRLAVPRGNGTIAVDPDQHRGHRIDDALQVQAHARHLLLGAAALGRVAQHHGIQAPAAQLQGRQRQVTGKGHAVLTAGGELMIRSAMAQRWVMQRGLHPRLAALWVVFVQEQAHAQSHQLVRRVAEQALGGRIEGFDQTGVVDHDDAVRTGRHRGTPADIGVIDGARQLLAPTAEQATEDDRERVFDRTLVDHRLFDRDGGPFQRLLATIGEAPGELPARRRQTRSNPIEQLPDGHRIDEQGIDEQGIDVATRGRCPGAPHGRGAGAIQVLQPAGPIGDDHRCQDAVHQLRGPRGRRIAWRRVFTHLLALRRASLWRARATRR